MKKLVGVMIIMCIVCMSLLQVFAEQNTITWNGMELRPSRYTEQDFDKSGDVILKMEHEVYAKDIEKIFYIFENHTDIETMYGIEADLEILLNGQWYEIPLQRCIDDVGISLHANAKSGDVFYWNTEKYNLTEGKYRIIKSLSATAYGNAREVFGSRKYYATFEIGDSIYTRSTPYGREQLQYLPKKYTKEMAIKNHDVVLVEGEKSENTEAINEFIEKTKLGIPALLRIARYLKNGDVIITDVEYKQGENTYSYEFFYREKGKENETKIYPYMITNGDSVYLSNWASWALKDKYQGQIGQYFFSKANNENAVKQIEAITETRRQRNATEYCITKRAEMGEYIRYPFCAENDMEYVLKMQRKEHINPKVIDIIWYNEKEFLIKMVSDDRKQGYTIVYNICEESIREYRVNLKHL